MHLHTQYSLLDGATKIDSLFDRCKELGMPAVAITDHGNMYGAYQFFLKGREKGVKPIIGCEFYIVDDLTVKSGKVMGDFNHLILLARDNRGYKSLVKLNSIAFVDGFYYKPRIDFKTLSRHADGLICLSACLAGELPRLIMDGRLADAEKTALKYKALFGEYYYLELQDHGIPEQKLVNARLIEMSKKLGIPLVATNDVHYLRREDAEVQDVLMCIQMQKTLDDKNRMKFSTDEFYLKSGEEMETLFSAVPEALANTVKIADMCDVTIEKENLIPNYVPDNGQTPYDFLRGLMEEGLKKRYDEITPEIRERAEYELGVIAKMGFVEYYLIVWDFINYAKSIGVNVGPGRGSGAGSIIAYAIGITNIDPLRFNLLFERFLNPERVSMPDFDIDFRDDRREEIIEYVTNKYGRDKVSQIITFGTLKAKNAIKDVGRVLNVPYSERDRVTKLMTSNLKCNIDMEFGFVPPGKDYPDPDPELKEIYKSDLQIQRVVDIARGLEGMPKNTSKHAAGVVICRYDISDHVPLQRNGEDITTQYDKNEVEQLGMLKMDFLGLRTLTDIAKAIELIKANKGVDISFDRETYDDPQVFELISGGDTDAVFQLESPGMKKLMTRLRPNSLEDIIAGISLFRPGPMASIDDYIEGKNNPEKVKYKHPLLKQTLDVTYGCMVYQEQVMKIVQDIAGYSLGQADIIRRVMSKKKASEMAKHKDYFINGQKDKNGNVIIEGAVARGVDPAVAESIFAEMAKFAEYAFNKSHAACYAVVAYQTAYLKRYYPIEFLAAVLNNRIDNTDEVTKYIGYCREKGIKVLPPDINESDVEFSVKGDEVRFGLMAIKNVGENALRVIVDERKAHGAYTGLEDLLSRLPLGTVNKRAVESMIKAGVFDSFGARRSQLMAVYEKMMDIAIADRKQKESGQFSMFEMLGGGGSSVKVPLPDIPEYDDKYKFDLEKEVLGMYVTGHPLQNVAEEMKNFSFNTGVLQDLMEETEDGEEGESGYSQELLALNHSKVTMGGILSGVTKKITKSNNTMATARLEDLYGGIDLVLFSRAYENLKDRLVNDAMVKIKGTLVIEEGYAPKINVEDLREWRAGEQKPQEPQKVTKLYINLTDESKYDDVVSVLEGYEGGLPVVLVKGGKGFALPLKVRECRALHIELDELIGEQNVKLVQR